MPLKQATGKGKKSLNAAVSANISELKKANESKPPSQQRPHKQIVAIAIDAAKRKKK